MEKMIWLWWLCYYIINNCSNQWVYNFRVKLCILWILIHVDINGICLFYWIQIIKSITKKKKLKNISDRHIQTSRISLWISTMVTKKAHYLFMQQCMMGAMNEVWLVASRIHCKMLYNCHHYWDSQADSWCLLKWS